MRSIASLSPLKFKNIGRFSQSGKIHRLHINWQRIHLAKDSTGKDFMKISKNFHENLPVESFAR
jgi:hypothetical protein